MCIRYVFQEFSPKQRSLMEKRIGEIYEDFVVDVAAGRKLSVEEVRCVHTYNYSNCVVGRHP